MKVILLIVSILLAINGQVGTVASNPSELYFNDYRQIQRKLRSETKRIEKQVENSNRRFVNNVARYGQCRSNEWRVIFEAPMNELNSRVLQLKQYKKDALDTKGKMNSVWLDQARIININRLQPNEPITDFVIWYENFASDMKQGPLQELELYSLAQNKLSEAYEDMSRTCEGAHDAANNSHIWVLGVRGLISEVSSILG